MVQAILPRRSCAVQRCGHAIEEREPATDAKARSTTWVLAPHGSVTTRQMLPFDDPTPRHLMSSFLVTIFRHPTGPRTAYVAPSGTGASRETVACYVHDLCRSDALVGPARLHVLLYGLIQERRIGRSFKAWVCRCRTPRFHATRRERSPVLHDGIYGRRRDKDLHVRQDLLICVDGAVSR